MHRIISPFLLLAASASFQSTAYGFFVDGEGHYSLKGETRTAPAFSKKTGIYQAIEQSFRLKGEARFSDQSSMNLEFRLLDNPREAYLGDTAEPRNCPQNSTGNSQNTATNNSPCAGVHQNTGEPGYRSYQPKITKAFVRYASDYCILEAGRRGRNWGLGIFMDSGDDPFETESSVYDGFTCNLNIQKTQTLGFSVGYDKLAETGVALDPEDKERGRRFGANDSNDDIDQYFFTIEYDDRKANAGAPLTKQVGFYFAQINSKSVTDGGSSTDLKFFDLYTGFYMGDIVFRNELLFRIGRSADPSWQTRGGAIVSDDDSPVPVNKLDSIGLAGSLEWTLARSGGTIGPAEYNKGDATRHLVFFNYAYAPGDKQGYYNDNHPGLSLENTEDAILAKDRDRRASAMAFHRNYKPALLLFNQRPEADNLIVDGIFDPSRVENTTLASFGYRYESLDTPSFEAKLITARLNTGINQKVKDYYDKRKDCSESSSSRPDCENYGGTNPDTKDDGLRPVGFFGTSLGYELDLSVSYKLGRAAELGLATAFALPGNAWKIDVKSNPTNDLLVQSYATFNF